MSAVPSMSVYDFAMEWAVTHGWIFRESTSVKVGLIYMDSQKRFLAVHPDSAIQTIEMNTNGPILPSNSKNVS